jgi:uncharacterized protein YjiK
VKPFSLFNLLLAGLPVAGPATAQVASVDLATYSLRSTINLPASPLLETSALTYVWDTDRLVTIPDSTEGVFELSLSGAILSQMSMTGFEDVEGITYLGAGRFAIAEERQQRVYRFTYVPGGTLARSMLQSAPLGSPIGNEGIEGVSFEPLTGFTFAVKEKNPTRVLRASIDYKAGTASFTDLFNPASLGVLDLADVAVLSTVPSLVGTSDQDNLLLLSQASARLLEVSRTGVVLSQLSLTGIATTAEGVTIDPRGVIYICDETPRLYVYAPPCLANCDGSSGTPLLTANDFQCFLNAYANGFSTADCDHAGGLPALTPNDFLCFVNGYAAGCP